MTPVERKSAISWAPKPRSARTSSLCSPRPGPALAGTFGLAWTVTGLLMVASRSSTPASGTTMSLAFSCGSLAASCGVWTVPYVIRA